MLACGSTGSPSSPVTRPSPHAAAAFVAAVAILAAPRDRRLWVAGKAKIDDWGSRPAAELHLEDAAWAD